MWQEWEQGRGRSEHSSLSAGRGEVWRCVLPGPPASSPFLGQEASLILAGAGRVLTHTELSLGVQLKALWAADLILFCKAKGTGPEFMWAPVPKVPGERRRRLI